MSILEETVHSEGHSGLGSLREFVRVRPFRNHSLIHPTIPCVFMRDTVEAVVNVSRN